MLPGVSRATAFERAALFGFLASLLLPIKFNALFIYLLIASMFYYRRFGHAWEELKSNRTYLLLAVYWLLIGISGLYSEEPITGVKALETRLPLIALPVVLTAIPWDSRLRSQSVRVFILSLVAVSLYSIFSTIVEYNIEPGELKFFSFMLPVTIGLTSTYYGFFVLWALLFLFGEIVQDRLFPPLIGVLLATYLMVFLFLISSRAAVGIFAICIGVLVLRLLFMAEYKQKRKMVLSIVAVFVVTGSLSLIYMPYIRQRIVEAVQGYGGDPRYNVHVSTISIIKKNPILGTGIGDVDRDLRLMYEEIGFQEGIDDSLNPHNDWLHTYAAAGLPALAALVGVLIMIIVSAVRSGDFYECCLVIFFLLATQTESILNRQKGAIIFSLTLTMICFLKLFRLKDDKVNG